MGEVVKKEEMMHNLIERYAYAVAKILPKKMQEDVRKDIIAEIKEQVSLDPSEEEVVDILEQIGTPEELANEYRGEGRSLIGGKYYESYVTNIKDAFPMALAVGVILSLVMIPMEVFGGDGIVGVVLGLIKHVISVAFSVVLQLVCLMTVGYIAVEKYEFGQKEKKKKGWNPKELPSVPTEAEEKLNIARGESLVGIIFGTLIFGCFISVVYKGIWGIWASQWTIKTILLDEVVDIWVLRKYVPAICVFFMIYLLGSMFKLLYGKLTWEIAIQQAIYRLAMSGLILMIVMQKTFIRASFIEVIEGAGIPVPMMEEIPLLVLVLAILIGVASVVSVVLSFNKLLQSKEN